MSWEKMKIPGRSGNSLPGDRGRYLLWLEPPLIEEDGHYVHFSWMGESYRVRDYIREQQTRGLRDLTVLDVWNAAKDRRPCTGELHVPIENYEFWMKKLTELSERRRREAVSGDWAPLSCRQSP